MGSCEVGWNVRGYADYHHKSPTEVPATLVILVRFVLPRLYYEPSFGMARRKTLKQMDTVVREFVIA